MKKTFLYRFFGIGKMPAAEVSALQSEGLVLMDEGFKGTTTYRNFRSPGRISNWKRQWYTASIAITETRFTAFQYAGKTIDVSFADERFDKLGFAVEEDGALLVRFDASLFHADSSGTLEYRFYTFLAREFLDRLRQKTADRSQK